MQCEKLRKCFSLLFFVPAAAYTASKTVAKVAEAVGIKNYGEIVMRRTALTPALASFSCVLVCLPLAALAEKPTLVEVVNADPIPVLASPAPPVFVRKQMPVFLGSSDDSARTRVIPFTRRTLIEDANVQISLIHQVAGCVVDLSKRATGSTGAGAVILEVEHPDKDLARWSDGQVTQQHLGRGIVVEPSEEIVVTITYFTNPDVPNAGASYFCSADVQLFGEELP